MPASRAELIRTEALLRELRRYRRMRERASHVQRISSAWSLHDEGCLSGISAAMRFVERFACNEKKRLEKKESLKAK